jgi:hypothetical protein
MEIENIVTGDVLVITRRIFLDLFEIFVIFFCNGIPLFVLLECLKEGMGVGHLERRKHIIPYYVIVAANELAKGFYPLPPSCTFETLQSTYGI